METKICQSCGMPMEVTEHFGTNGDDSPNVDSMFLSAERERARSGHTLV